MSKVLTFKVEIKELEDKNWRKIEITDTKTIADLAYTILATFDSLAYHLYDITYKDKIYSADSRSRDAIANIISTYRERLPIDDNKGKDTLSDDPIANQVIISKLPLPSDFQWITIDNERVPFKMADVLYLSALFQKKTYRCTFKAREFKDRLITIKNIEELEELKKEVESYNWN